MGEHCRSGADFPDSVLSVKDEDMLHDKVSGSKPPISQVALIATAILSSEPRRLMLSEIFKWVTHRFPYFKMNDVSWRNSIRHNLSVNECFVKCGRSEAGKGNYWTVHPINVQDFIRGDFRRRHARQRVYRLTKTFSNSVTCNDGMTSLEPSVTSPCYHVMTERAVTSQSLIEEFGFDVSLPSPGF